MAYPPTHTYTLHGLIPTGVLKERLAIIERLAPKFFEGDRFLDVGCSKGFFSLLAAARCKKVVGIDKDKSRVDFCRQVGPANTEFLNQSFSEFETSLMFDRVFMGNVFHHVYKEEQGWAWVDKLIKMSSDLIIVEGPIGLQCKDLRDMLPEHLHRGFELEHFTEPLGRYFRKIEDAKSPSYTPDRRIMVFKRVQFGV